MWSGCFTIITESKFSDRMLNGGNYQSGPFLEDPFKGADFPYICANVTYKYSRRPILPPFVIRKVKGSAIAFIGAVLKETPTMVVPSGVADIFFGDEAEAINKSVKIIRRMGVHSIVVLLHQGGPRHLMESLQTQWFRMKTEKKSWSPRHGRQLRLKKEYLQ